MARFTDQFTRFNPRTFPPGILIPTWPSLVQRDACALLEGVDDNELEDLALVVDKAIDEYAEPHQFATARDSWIRTRIKPEWLNQSELKTVDGIRNTVGDLNLFLACIDRTSPLQDHPSLSRFDTWHMLAVLALWKLVDARDVIFKHAPDLIGGMIRPKEQDRLMHGAAIAMEAQAAVSNGLQLQMRSTHLLAMQKARDVLEMAQRSTKGSKAVTTRHSKYDTIRLAAFALADSDSTLSMTDAADLITNNIEWRKNEFVKYITAYRWLQNRKSWEAKIAARSKKL
jgi:hypothetical protein